MTSNFEVDTFFEQKKCGKYRDLHHIINNRMRICVTVSIFLLLFSTCNRKDNFRPELQKRINKIIKEKEFGYQDSNDISFLRDSCSKNELLILINHHAPIVRMFAYYAIVKRNEPDFFSILQNHLSDTAKITWWYFDDAARDITISDLMVIKSERRLDRKQKDTLIDLVLNKHLYLQTANWMMEDMEPRETYYKIIRQEAIKRKESCNQERAVYALSKFKRQGDVALINKALFAAMDNCDFLAFKIIEAFPDSSFFTHLNHYFETRIKREKQSSSDDLEIYCRAVAQYKDSSALKILQALTEKNTYPDDWYLPQNKEYVFKSINKYKCSLYSNLFKMLKPQMSKYIFSEIQSPFQEALTW